MWRRMPKSAIGEVVLTFYLKAPVDEILELWDRLYDNVKIDSVVISLLPIPSTG